MTELLAPAGSYESLCAAVNAGADAVYIGGRSFGARAYAENPDEAGLIRGIEYCHLHGKKLYLTVNTLLKEEELRNQLYPYLLPYYENGIDAVIVQDFGVVRFVRECFPDLELHASTQMTVTGPDGVQLLQSAGITRVVPARELSLSELCLIIDQTGIEVETFIHGAMCYSYSGQCLFSSMLGGRSGNRGRCAQPCRLPYCIPAGNGRNAARAGEESFLLSMKDMCTLELLPDLIDAGIASLKIEGRMKRPEYTAGVVSIYRKYIDRYAGYGRDDYRVEEADLRDLKDLYNRGGFSSGYYQMHNGKTMMSFERPNHRGTAAAEVKSSTKGRVTLTALEPLNKEDVLELPDGRQITMPEAVACGGVFSVTLEQSARTKKRPADGNASAVRTGRERYPNAACGDIWYRTRNEKLLQELHEKYVVPVFKRKIKGDLRISYNEPAILNLYCADVSVTVTGDIAEPALKSPTGPDSIRKQMGKTGNTPFEFDRLEVSLDDGLFVSVKKLNELRRSGTQRLQEALLQKAGKRLNSGNTVGPAPGRSFSDPGRAPLRGEAPCRLNVLVTSAWQLDAVLDFKNYVFDTLYLDLMLFGMPEDLEDTYETSAGMIRAVKEHGAKCFLSLPPVLRARERALLNSGAMQCLMRSMDGFLLHTVDELYFMKKFLSQNGLSAELAADDSLYAYNRYAAAFFREQGVRRMTLPSELNSRELSELDTMESELNLYGYQPLMQSAQCIVKNTGRCARTSVITYLRDRKNTAFPVLNRCQVCCNTIYNSLPLQLGGYMEEVRRLAPSFIRLTFTIESGGETKQILQKYCSLLTNGQEYDAGAWKQEGTRGHFKRGVE